MVRTALLVRLEAKAGQEANVEAFLLESLAMIERESETTAWFALRLGPQSYAIFEAFPDESGRRAHLIGRFADLLLQRSNALFETTPVIERVDVLAAKLPPRASP